MTEERKQQYQYQADRNSNMAIITFRHYMSQLHREANIPVDPDMVAEWEDIIKCILSAAEYQTRAIMEE